jgi:hypothetical protein
MDAQTNHTRCNSRLAVLVVGASLAGAVLAGCSVKTQLFIPEHRDPVTGELQIPKEAEYVAGGRGELTWKIPHDGRVYVRDSTAERALFSVPVTRGQHFSIVPSEDRASLDGEDVPAADMQTRNEHRIYFLASGTSGDSNTASHYTDNSSRNSRSSNTED